MALTRVLARAFGGVDSGGVRAISENSTCPHTVDVGAPPWLEDNGPWLVSGCRWSEGVFAHHCDTAPNGMYATLVWRQGAVCRARGTWARGSKAVRKLLVVGYRRKSALQVGIHPVLPSPPSHVCVLG